MCRLWIAIAFLYFSGSTILPSRAADVVKFGQLEYEVTEVAVAKSSSARLARFEIENPEMLRKYIYLPAGTILFLLDHKVRDGRTYQLAVSENGMPLYVLRGLNYFPTTRFTGFRGEFAAIPRANIVAETQQYGQITLTPSEVYSMTFEDHPFVNITITKDKMGSRHRKDEIIKIPEDDIAYVPLPVDSGAKPPNPIQIYDFRTALDDVLSGVTDGDLDKVTKFKEYVAGKFIAEKQCEDVINYGLGISADLAAEFDNWLSPIEAKLALSGSFNATREYKRGVEFLIERYAVLDRVYELKKERVAEDCASLDDNRRIRIAADQDMAELNSQDATDLGLETDVKGLIVYRCRAEYLKIEQSLYDQELRPSAARLLISRFTIYKNAGDASSCGPHIN